MQRHGVGLAADMAGHHRHRAEFAHRARVAQQHAVQQRPFHVRQRDAEKGLEPRGAERQRRFFLLGALLLHQRNELAHDERKGDEDRRQHHAGQREDDLDVVRDQPRPEIALQPEQQHEDQTGDHRRHRERQIDQRDQKVLAAKLEFGDRPGADNAEHDIGCDRYGGDDQRQPDRRQRVGIAQRREIGADALRERLREHADQRQHDEQAPEMPPPRRSTASAPRPGRCGHRPGAGSCSARRTKRSAPAGAASFC